MRSKFYDRPRLPSYSAIASTLALVFSLAALCVGGAMATGVLVTSKQIRNGAILSQDIHKSAVRSSDIGGGAVKSDDIKNGTVDSADIGDGDVTPTDVSMPAPVQLQEGSSSAGNAGFDAFRVVDVVGAYTKVDPTSLLEVDWSGSVGAPSTAACVFQLRVDGQSAGQSAGMAYVEPGEAQSVGASALFQDLPAGVHQVEVWAMVSLNHYGEGPFTCTVGPEKAGIGQTFVVSEQVV
jgi:hypothetical protein